MNMNHQESSDLEERWEEVAFDLTEYSSSYIQLIFQSFNQDFIQGLSRVDENFISSVLNIL